MTVRIDALGEAASGEVVSLVPDGSGGARTLPVEVRIDALNGPLTAGMSATGEVEVGAASEGVGDHEGRRHQEIGANARVNPSLEVAIS